MGMIAKIGEAGYVELSWQSGQQLYQVECGFAYPKESGALPTLHQAGVAHTLRHDAEPCLALQTDFMPLPTVQNKNEHCEAQKKNTHLLM
jgi:hypothetical protein